MHDKLVRRLEQLDWKYAAFECAAGLAKNRISKWGAGQGEPTARQALRMARLLAVPLEWLVDDSAGEGDLAGLSREELDLLSEARRIGIEAARRRLAGANDVFRPGATQDRGEPRALDRQPQGDDVPADEPRQPR